MIPEISPVAPVGPHWSHINGLDKPQRPTGTLPVARNRLPVAPGVGTRYKRPDRRRNDGDQISSGRERGLGKPKTSLQSAVTGPTGGFWV